MKKLALLVGLLAILCGVVYADHVPGHLDFPDMPFLSEAAVYDDPGGAVLVCFMIELGVDDTEVIPDFKIRVIDSWAIIDATDTISYQITDGTFGNNLISFDTTNIGFQGTSAWDGDYAEIDPGAGESIYVDALPTGTTAAGHLYILAVRVL